MVVSFYYLRSQHRLDYYAFVREDGIAENLQAVCFIAAAVFAGLTARRLLVRRERFLAVMFGVLSLGCFVIGGEEVSWGQRIVGWESSEYFHEENMQEETNIHNDSALKHLVHPIGIAVGIYATLSCVLNASLRRRGAKRESFFTADWPVAGYFAVFTGIYIIAEYLNPSLRAWYGGFDVILWQDLEMAESFLAAGILFAVVLKFRAVPRFFGEVKRQPAVRSVPRFA
jgi:hypothetical protein